MWYATEIMDFTDAVGYEDSNKKSRQQKKKLSSSFPWVEKLNKEGNKEAGFNRKSLKIS